MKTHIQGIPCTIDYRISGRYRPAITQAEPDFCHEAEYPTVEFTVCDRRGRQAPWLECKLTPADTERIEQEILEDLQD